MTERVGKHGVVFAFAQCGNSNSEMVGTHYRSVVLAVVRAISVSRQYALVSDHYSDQ